MALGTPVNVATLFGGLSATTGSFTIAAGHAIYVAVGTRRNTSSVPGVASISDSQGLTWNAVVNHAFSLSNPRIRLQVWRATSNGNSMTVTITLGANTNRFGAQVVSISGANSDFSNIGEADSASGDPAPNLANAPAASSLVLGFLFTNLMSSAVDPPAGFTELNEFFATGGDSDIVQTVYDPPVSPSQSATWATSNNNATACLIEVESLSTAYDIAIAPGSYAQAGTASILKAQRKLALAPGSYVSTGSAIAIGKRTSLTFSPGSYAGTGTYIGLRASLSISINPGLYALGGHAIGLGKGMSLAVGAGAYAAAGQAIGLLAYRKLGIAVGSHAVAGGAIGLGHGQAFAIDPGSYAFAYGTIGFSRTHAPSETPDLRILFARGEDRRAIVAHQVRNVRPASIGRTISLSGRGE